MAQRKSIDHATDLAREALRASPIFQVLESTELENILKHAATRRIPRGAVALHKGDAGQSMLLILHGRMRITSMHEDGREVALGVVGPGEAIGEMSLLDGQARSAEASALEDCLVLLIERAFFLRLLAGSPDLCLRLIAMLSRRLRNANAALEELTLLDLPARLANLLQRLGRDCGVTTPGGTRIEIRLSQKDLSALVGASREKVNRQLRQWEQAGWIAKDNGYVVLRRPDLLSC
jgi:CRP-like cAMP-binding protein